jgi:hypothetical protein
MIRDRAFGCRLTGERYIRLARRHTVSLAAVDMWGAQMATIFINHVSRDDCRRPI